MDKTKFKAILTVAIIILAGSLGVILTAIDFHQTNGQSSSNNLVIDHGDWDVDWYQQDNPDITVRNALNNLVSKGKITLEWNGDSIKSIDGKSSDDNYRWGLWVVKKGDNQYINLREQYDSSVSDYTVCTVGLTYGDYTPAPATDYLGNCIYGIKAVNRTVSLSPAITEMVCSIGAVDSIVGSDTASDYPSEFVKRKAEGKVIEVADFRSASLEKIISVNPDVAFFDGSATPTIEVAKKLINTTSVQVVVLYPGWTARQIMDNIFIVGTCLGEKYEERTLSLLTKITDAMVELQEITSHAQSKAKGVVLMCDAGQADWCAGKETSVRSYIVAMNGEYGFDNLEITWATLNQEELVRINPDFIIVITSSYKGQTGYNQMLNDHSSTWQSLKAYKDGKIFMLYDQANNITARLGPRFVECCEIFAKYMYPDLFTDKIPLNYLGDDYSNYLTITKGVLA